MACNWPFFSSLKRMWLKSKVRFDHSRRHHSLQGSNQRSEVDCELFESGDSKWAIVEFSPSKRTDIAALYSTDSNLPQGPFNWPEFELVDGYKAKTDEKSGVSLNTYLAIAVLALSVVFLGVVVYKKKNGLI